MPWTHKCHELEGMLDGRGLLSGAARDPQGTEQHPNIENRIGALIPSQSRITASAKTIRPILFPT
jgi:hypothetical protein